MKKVLVYGGVASAALVRGAQWKRDFTFDKTLTIYVDDDDILFDDYDITEGYEIRYVSLLNNHAGGKFAVSSESTERVFILEANYERNDNHTLSYNKYFTSQLIRKTDADTFGYDAQIFGDDVTGDILAVGYIDDDSSANDEGYVGVYKRGVSRWSRTQVLEPNHRYTDAKIDNDFGKQIAVDRVSQRQLAINCASCSSTLGSVFVYEPTSPEADQWTNTQVLTPIDKFGEDTDFVSIYDKTLAFYGAETSGAGPYGVNVFSKNEKGIWSQQQTLTLSGDHDVLDVSVYEDTIAVGWDVDYNGDANVGEVRLYAASDAVPGPKGRPKQWSLNQVLRVEKDTIDGGELFGTTINFDGDNLLITEGQATTGANVYFYKREQGMWSVQQTFTNEEVGPISDADLSGDIAIVNQYDQKTTTYTLADDKECLVFSVEDHFGDGWGGARLTIEAPNGDKEFFAPSCHSVNPWVFRYCPDSDAGGLYKVSIPDAVKTKYYWEIFWRVYTESTGEWLFGNHETRADFFYDVKKQSFVPRKIDHSVPLNVTCTDCREEDGQVVDTRRSLKWSSGTRSPTVSPAPTMSQDDDRLQWDTFVFKSGATSSQTWFHDSQSSTSYYISDLAGHRLIKTGTACSDINNGLTLECDAHLPDGQYVLRVGGALHADNQDNLNWEFCGIQGNAGTGDAIQKQLIFDVKGGVCAPYSLTYYEGLCGDISKDLFLEVSIILSGITESTLTSADTQGLESAVAQVLGVDASNMKLARREGEFFTFKFTADVSKFGYDATDAEDSVAALEYFEGVVSEKSGQLLTSIKQMCATSGNFENLAHIAVDSGKLLELVVPEASTKNVKDEAVFSQGDVSASAPEAHVTFSDKVVSTYAFPTSVLGYVLVACSVLFVAYLVKQRKA